MRFQSYVFQIVGQVNSFINLQALLNVHLLNKDDCNNKLQVPTVISKEICALCLYICKFSLFKNNNRPPVTLFLNSVIETVTMDFFQLLLMRQHL